MTRESQPKRQKCHDNPSGILRQRNRTQAEPLFFTKLPAEIRLLIYEKIFGRRTVHIIILNCWYYFSNEKPRMHHRVCCRDPQIDFMQHMLCCSDSLRYPQLDMSILFTCRQAYSEGIMVLYGTNTFQFTNHFQFDTFRTSVPRRCLEAIKSLEVNWVLTDVKMFGYSDLSFWEFLRGLPNVHELFINIRSDSGSPGELTRCLDHLDKLACKRGLKKLRVVVPYRFFTVYESRKEVEETTNAIEHYWKARRVVSDGSESSNKRLYYVESRTSYSNYKNGGQVNV